VQRVGRARSLLACALLAASAAGATMARAAGSAHRAPARIMFGLGPEADGARGSSLASAAPVRMLTSWFNGSADLGWMSAWKRTEVRRDYAAGYALHLVVWSGEHNSTSPTRYGPACGRAYPISAQFLSDMTQLAQIFSGPRSSRLYVTLFAEFQTYPCKEDQWAGEPQSTAYLQALKDQYRAALRIFHTFAPSSAVSLGWGGWQERWDSPATGGGRSLFPHFADVMSESDFESFEVLGSGSDVSEIRAMTHELARFGPVMLAYYRPNEDVGQGSSHPEIVLSGSYLAQLSRERLFAISFMDDRFMPPNTPRFALVRDAVRRYGCRRCTPPALNPRAKGAGRARRRR
jgi:hypothetical protein